MADHTFTDGVAAVAGTSGTPRIVDIAEVLLEMGLSGSDTEEERAIVEMAILRTEGIVRSYLKYDPTRSSRTEYYPQQDYELTARTSVWEAEGNQAILRRRADAANSELQVRHIPIRSITTLSIDYDGRSDSKSGAFATNKTEGEDYWPNYDGLDDAGEKICRDGIIRSIGDWAITPGSVKIVYVAGYTDDELHGQGGVVNASPIVNAIINESVRKAKKALLQMKTTMGWTAGPILREKLGDYAVGYGSVIASRLFGETWNLTPESMESLSDFVNWGYAL